MRSPAAVILLLYSLSSSCYAFCSLNAPKSIVKQLFVSLEEPPSSTSIYDDDDDGDGEDKQTIAALPIRRYRRSKKEPLIAIIGRPNVGKSALVNRIAGTMSGGAIVADESGITRDRTYRDAEFLGENFQLIDTGGLVFDDDENTLFAKEIRQQAMVAIREAAGVIMVVDGKVGMSSMDQAIANFLRKEVLKDIPVHVAVNKCESEQTGGLAAAEFWNLGLGEPFAVSALHGVGTAELLETMFDSISKKGSAIEGFGTKIKVMQQAKKNMKSKELLPGEDETDAFLRRKYGIGDAAERAAQKYDDAMTAFDAQEKPVSDSISSLSCCSCHGRNITHGLNVTIQKGGNQRCHYWSPKRRKIIFAQRDLR